MLKIYKLKFGIIAFCRFFGNRNSVINLENSNENKGRRKRDRTKIRADEIRADKVSNKLYRNDKFQKNHGNDCPGVRC